MERWEDIIYFGGKYQISNLGNIKSLNYNKERILKQGIRTNYNYVGLSKNGKIINTSVHRLVAQAFLGLDIKNSKILVCHKDDNPLNNKLNNLFLGTHKDNSNDMAKKGRSGGRCGKTGKDNPRSKQVNQYTKDGVFIKTWNSLADIERELKINHGNISSCCSGRIKMASGFIWKYNKTGL